MQKTSAQAAFLTIGSILIVLIAWACGSNILLSYEDRLRLWQEFDGNAYKAYNEHDYEKAATLFSAAINAAEGFTGGRQYLALSLQGLADTDQARGKTAEPTPLLERSANIYEELRKTSGKDYRPFARDSVKALLKLARLYQQAGRFNQAADLYKRALDIEQSFQMRDLRKELLGEYVTLLQTMGRSVEATQRAIELQEAVQGKVAPMDVLTLYCKSANAAAAAGKLDEAKKFADLAYRATENSTREENLIVHDCLSNLGIIFLGKSELAKAEGVLEPALLLLSRTSTDDQSLQTRIIGTCLSLHSVYLRESKLPEAERMLQRALQVAERTKHSADMQTLMISINYNLLLVYMKESRFAEAERMLRSLLQLAERTKHSGDWSATYCQMSLLCLHKPDATDLARRCEHALTEPKRLHLTPAVQCQMYLDLSWLYMRERKWTDLRRLCLSALSAPDWPSFGPSGKAAIRFGLGVAYLNLTQLRQAELCFTELASMPMENLECIAGAHTRGKDLYLPGMEYEQKEAVFYQLIHKQAPSARTQAWARGLLAQLFAEQKKYDQARALYKEEIEILKQLKPPDKRLLNDIQQLYAQLPNRNAGTQ